MIPLWETTKLTPIALIRKKICLNLEAFKPITFSEEPAIDIRSNSLWKDRYTIIITSSINPRGIQLLSARGIIPIIHDSARLTFWPSKKNNIVIKAVKNEFTIIPEIIKEDEEYDFVFMAIMNINMADKIPKKIAKIGIILSNKPEKLYENNLIEEIEKKEERKIASEQPKEAPAEIPRVYGSAKGFFKIICITRPVIESVAPIKKAEIKEGILMLFIIVFKTSRFGVKSKWSMDFTTILGEIKEFPKDNRRKNKIKEKKRRRKILIRNL